MFHFSPQLRYPSVPREYISCYAPHFEGSCEACAAVSAESLAAVQVLVPYQ